MSVAGILASSLFSNTVASVGQKAPTTSSANGSTITPTFASTLLQQPSASQGSASTSSLSAAINQLGQDLQSGNVTAARSDFSGIRSIFSHRPSQSATSSAAATTSSLASPLAGSDLQSSALASAWQAYSAQQLSNSPQAGSGALSLNA